MALDVTIIIPTYQGERWLRDTLAAIRQQEYSGSIHILAVDSGSTDDTLAILGEFDAQVIEIPQQAFSHGYARNLGVRHAQTDIVVFMSQDVLPVGDDWLEKLVALLADSKIGGAHVRQLPRPDATPLEVFFQTEMYPAQSKRFTHQPGDRLTLDSIFYSNVCSITHRDLCLRFPFPEDLIMSEDQAYAKALLTAGYDTLYSAEVTVVHSHHYNVKTLFRRNFDSAYSLKDVTEDALLHIAVSGVTYVAHEILFLAKRREWKLLFYLPIYESARILARLLGGHADRLPRSLARTLSLHSSYWQRVQPAEMGTYES